MSDVYLFVFVLYRESQEREVSRVVREREAERQVFALFICLLFNCLFICLFVYLFIC